MPLKTIVMTSILMASTFLIAILICDKIDGIHAEKRPDNFWLYHILLIIVSSNFNMYNFVFLWLAYYDASRRNYLIIKLSNSLELDFHIKDPITVRLPTINFLDSNSILAWLEARKIVLELGNRF